MAKVEPRDLEILNFFTENIDDYINLNIKLTIVQDPNDFNKIETGKVPFIIEKFQVKLKNYLNSVSFLNRYFRDGIRNEKKLEKDIKSFNKSLLKYKNRNKYNYKWR